VEERSHTHNLVSYRLVQRFRGRAPNLNFLGADSFLFIIVSILVEGYSENSVLKNNPRL